MNDQTRQSESHQSARPESSEQTATDAPIETQSSTDEDNLPLAERMAHVNKERDDLREQLLRNRAEFANYQKRAKQQADADRAYAVGTLAFDLLEPIDNLERATDALRSTVAEGISTGLDMVRKQLQDILAKHGVEPIAAVGQPFDPNLHDALMQQPSADHPEGTVVSELSKGYRIRDRVLRPSKVAVSVKPPAHS